MTGNERWLPVVGFEGIYSVSDMGRIRSEHRVVEKSNGMVQTVRERILKASPSGPQRNYLFVVLWRNKKPHPKKVHRMVLEAFVGPCPSGMEGCHGPGGVSDNRLTNLRWGTKSSNMLDQVRDGTHYSHGRTKTHCPQGHLYDEENTRYSQLKNCKVRYCRECKRLKSAERRARA